LNQLHTGTTVDGSPFYLPADLGDKKIAMLAQSKKGKTYGLGVILEELVVAGRPWIANDPANNLYGLRVKPDGSPSGLPVLVIGGTHGDIGFDKFSGELLAEALLSEPICAVIDVAFESLGSVRKFWTEFAGRLMRSKPEIPRAIFLEEAQVLIPQSAQGPAMQICKSAVAKLATIGGNFGYGVIAATQRPATIDKDVLSQCEAMIVMGMTHKKDRDTVRDWMEAKDIGKNAEEAFNELGSLKAGEAWYWAPNDDRFEKFTFRKRHTLHPREMQKLGLKASAVHLGEVTKFAERVKREMTKTQGAVPSPKALAKAAEVITEIPVGSGRMAEIADLRTTNAHLEAENVRLKAELSAAKISMRDANSRVESVRKYFLPQYESLKWLFESIAKTSSTAAGGIDVTVPPWPQWMEKAGKVGAKKCLGILCERGRLTQTQLATLSGLSMKGGHWRKCRAFLTKNDLATLEGEEIVVAQL
jgi:hypothetical protein